MSGCSCQADHDHSWAEDMDEVRALCPRYNPQLTTPCPGDYYCGCCGGFADLPPAGQHVACCASLHDQP